MDVARIEAGLIMLDVDYTPAPKAATDQQASGPYELGLDWAVHLDKGDFVGRSQLVKDKNHRMLLLVGIEIDHAYFTALHEDIGMPVPMPFIPWREVKPVYYIKPQLGFATCGTWSPTLKKYIALAQVSPVAAAPGNEVGIDMIVDRLRHRVPGTVVKLPFLNLERKKA
jgi:aminomethyltransferase